MGYQAPAILLAAVACLLLVYGRFWRQQGSAFSYPCLVLVLDGQEEFLEGFLRKTLLWCYWKGVPWRFLFLTTACSGATLAILRYFFYTYAFYQGGYIGEGAFPPAQPAAACKGPLYYCDLRKEKDFNSAWTRLYLTYLKK